ncbi:transcriptional regulator [Aerococcus urinaeequi]|uniref:transcriptional regulator n=1 Tax=Aerococcus urinaeequi TaxID=51665 RepID=UPI0035E1EAA1
MEEFKFYNVDDVMKMFECGKAQAYKIIRQLNDELQKQGKITIAGKVNKKYLEERI